MLNPHSSTLFIISPLFSSPSQSLKFTNRFLDIRTKYFLDTFWSASRLRFLSYAIL